MALTLRRRLRRLVTVLLVVGLLLAGGLVVLHLEASSAPDWYAPPAGDDPEVEMLAETVEYRLTEEFQRVRPEDDAWTVRIRESQLNAWLGTRLRPWVDGHVGDGWPAWLGTPQVHITSGGIVVAAPVTGEGGVSRVVTADLEPAVENGRPVARIVRIGVGRLSVPASAAEELAAALPGFDWPDQAAELLGRAHDLGALLERASGDASGSAGLRLVDDRRVRLEAIVLEAGALRITSRTSSPAAARAEVER